MEYKDGKPMVPISPDHALDDMPDWFLRELDEREKHETSILNGAMQTLGQGLLETQNAVRKHNCFYCGHFDRQNDTCRIARPPSRPPTFIIVHGCKQFWPEDDIPF